MAVKLRFAAATSISCLSHNFRKVSRDFSVGILTTHYGLYLREITVQFPDRAKGYFTSPKHPHGL
jgi:hypothetical protein